MPTRKRFDSLEGVLISWGLFYGSHPFQCPPDFFAAFLSHLLSLLFDCKMPENTEKLL